MEPPFSHAGELAALATACCWTVSALAFQNAGRRVGSLPVNLIRLVMAVVSPRRVHLGHPWHAAADGCLPPHLAVAGAVGPGGFHDRRPLPVSRLRPGRGADLDAADDPGAALHHDLRLPGDGRGSDADGAGRDGADHRRGVFGRLGTTPRRQRPDRAPPAGRDPPRSRRRRRSGARAGPRQVRHGLLQRLRLDPDPGAGRARRVRGRLHRDRPLAESPRRAR